MKQLLRATVSLKRAAICRGLVLVVDDETALWDPIEENSFFRLINVNDQMSSSLSDLVRDLRFEEDVLEDIKQDPEMFRFDRYKLGVLTDGLK